MRRRVGRHSLQVRPIALLAALCLWLPFGPAACGGHEQTGHHHRRPADINEYLERLDRPQRDAYQKPAEVLAALEIKPGMAVADLGAGSGYFTRRFADAVSDTGSVYAIDVEPEMLNYIRQSLAGRPSARTVTYLLTSPDESKLPPASVDLIFICNVYHHLENRPVYFDRLRQALKPGGRIAIIDFYHDERSGDVGFPRRHLVPRDTVVDELQKSGYHILSEHAFLPRQYFVEFGPVAR